MKPLDRITVLVTRPQAQAESLALAIEKEGGIAIRAPMLIIGRLKDDQTASQLVAGLTDFDIAIFVSKNAAECGVEIVEEQGQPLDGLKIFAVGLGTAGRLRELGVAEVETPSSEFSSEGLLRLDGLAEALVQLLSSAGQRRTFGAAARRRARKFFSATRLKKPLMEILEEARSQSVEERSGMPSAR